MNKTRKTIIIVTLLAMIAGITLSYLFWESEGTGIMLVILIMAAYGLTDIKKDDNKII